MKPGRRCRVGAVGRTASVAYALTAGSTNGLDWRSLSNSPVSETSFTVKKKKVRVALKKNRQNRTRSNDLTRKFRDDELTPAATPAVDRVRPKGDLSRHRTIIEDVEEGRPADRERRIPTLRHDGLSTCRRACAGE